MLDSTTRVLVSFCLISAVVVGFLAIVRVVQGAILNQRKGREGHSMWTMNNTSAKRWYNYVNMVLFGSILCIGSVPVMVYCVYATWRLVQNGENWRLMLAVMGVLLSFFLFGAYVVRSSLRQRPWT